MSLENVNREIIYDKLDNIKRVDGCLKCNDIFAVLSSSITRDKRLINDYTEDEVVIKYDLIKKRHIKCRYFTPEGISRYIHEGKVICYEIVCEYFDVNPIDREVETIMGFMINENTFDTKAVLKWLFGKKKSVKVLKTYVNIKILALWLNNYTNDDIIANRRAKILQMMGYDVSDTPQETDVQDTLNIEVDD